MIVAGVVFGAIAAVAGVASLVLQILGQRRQARLDRAQLDGIGATKRLVAIEEARVAEVDAERAAEALAAATATLFPSRGANPGTVNVRNHGPATATILDVTIWTGEERDGPGRTTSLFRGADAAPKALGKEQDLVLDTSMAGAVTMEVVWTDGRDGEHRKQTKIVIARDQPRRSPLDGSR